MMESEAPAGPLPEAEREPGETPVRPAPARRVTLKDIARRTGTSTAAVSAVLSGRSTSIRVGAETSERIRSVAAELGYRRNELAASLSSQRTGLLGVVFPYREAYWDGNPFNVQVLNGAAESAAKQGFSLLMYTQLEHAWGELQARDLLDGRADGTIVVAPLAAAAGQAQPLLRELAATDFPVVALCCALNAPVPNVNADDFGGSALATEHLIHLGHERIGMLAGPEELATTAPRTEGFQATMAAADLPLDADLLRPCRPEHNSGYRGAVQLLSRGDRPTALLACNDLAARGAVEAARHLGLSVPEDVSIVGFDDADFAATMAPPLTTVTYPSRAMAWQATSLLIQIVRGESPSATSLLLPTRLIVRQSTAPRPVGSRQ